MSKVIKILFQLGLVILIYPFSTELAVAGGTECKAPIYKPGDYYWQEDASEDTVITSDTDTERKWYVAPNPDICYITLQYEINDPCLRFLGYINAIEEMGLDLTPWNRGRIKKLTGLDFSSKEEVLRWLSSNRKKLFWSFEMNRLIVLEEDFPCKRIEPASGRQYWSAQNRGRADNMDTSATDRLWRNMDNPSTCYITPLGEINDTN